jgi:release factor glutamine methyltransferase
MSPTIAHLPKFIADKAAILERVGIESAAAEIEWILCHVLEVDRLNLYLHGTELLNEERIGRIDQVIERRTTRYPLQYILEESWFYGRKFFVSPSVMVPTPETELLCENAIKFLSQRQIQCPRILDVGVGSGVIAVTMALEVPSSHVVALDISPEALAVARRNAAELCRSFRIEFRQSNFFAAARENERFDLILSNPPYIAEPDYAGLMPEVLADPKIAMTAGEEGLDAIWAIIEKAPDHLAPGGRVMFEIGYNQAEKVARITERDPRYDSINILRDYNDIDRIVILSCAS